MSSPNCVDKSYESIFNVPSKYCAANKSGGYNATFDTITNADISGYNISCRKPDDQCKYTTVSQDAPKQSGGYCYQGDTGPPSSPVCSADESFDIYGSKNCIDSGWKINDPNYSGANKCCNTVLPADCKNVLPGGYTASDGFYGYIPPGGYIKSNSFPGYGKPQPPPSAPKQPPKAKTPPKKKSRFGSDSECMCNYFYIFLVIVVVCMIGYYVSKKKNPTPIISQTLAQFGKKIKRLI
jgi:hypothetical protein